MFTDQPVSTDPVSPLSVKCQGLTPYPPLIERARRLQELHTLGFFTDVTAELTNDQSLRRDSRRMRVRRRTRKRLFFAHPRPGKYMLRLVEFNTQTQKATPVWAMLLARICAEKFYMLSSA